MTITPAELAAWKELAAKATAGPWKCRVSLALNGGFIVDVAENVGFDANDNNATFIAAARTAMPRCLAEIERLRIETDALKMVCTEARELIGEFDADGKEIPRANLEALRALLWRASIKCRSEPKPTDQSTGD
jgi:hypothetical protein